MAGPREGSGGEIRVAGPREGSGGVGEREGNQLRGRGRVRGGVEAAAVRLASDELDGGGGWERKTAASVRVQCPTVTSTTSEEDGVMG